MDLLFEARDNISSERGYVAYYELAKYTHENNSSDSVLYDLAADFDWDDKLTNATRKLAHEDGFDDSPEWPDLERMVL